MQFTVEHDDMTCNNNQPNLSIHTLHIAYNPLLYLLEFSH